MRGAFGGMRASQYDLTIDFQGLMKSAAVAQLSGAEAQAGFARSREQAAALLYTRRVNVRARHVVEQNLELVAAITSRAAADPEFQFPRDPQAEQWCDQTMGREGWSSFALLNPGAGWGAKMWQVYLYGVV